MIKEYGGIEGRTFFVGDLHGCYDTFSEELEKVNFDFDNDRVFSVGDLVDRGTQNMKCLRLLHKPWFHAVRGNHDDLVVGGLGGINAYLHCWMQNGGKWVNELSTDDLHELNNCLLPKLKDLPYIIKVGEVAVVHAEIELDSVDEVSLDDAQMLTWGRNRINTHNTSLVSGVKYIVCGHTPVAEPTKVGNHIYIDTGACFETGKLTLIDINDLGEV